MKETLRRFTDYKYVPPQGLILLAWIKNEGGKAQVFSIIVRICSAVYEYTTKKKSAPLFLDPTEIISWSCKLGKIKLSW